jgi:hypothetical protein
MQVRVEHLSNEYYGINQSTWLPYIGFKRTAFEQKDPSYSVLSGIGFQRQQEKAFHAIDTPSGFAQSFSGQYYLNEQSLNWLSDTQITFQGLHPRHSADISFKLQNLSYPNSLIETSPVFGSIEQAGFSSTMQTDYRINLGAVGQSFTPLLYWRNTEITFSLLNQQTDVETENAYGIGIAPSMNFMSNANIRLQPRAVVYYLPESGEVKLTYQISLGGF